MGNIYRLYIYIYIYIYTYKTTLRVIRRFGGGGRGWKGFSAPSQTESHEHLCPKLLSMVVVCFLLSILRVVMSRCLVAFLTKSTTNIIFGKYLSSNAAPSRCNDKNPKTSRGWCFLSLHRADGTMHIAEFSYLFLGKSIISETQRTTDMYVATTRTKPVALRTTLPKDGVVNLANAAMYVIT